jgi:large repetitive protein
VNVPPEAAFEAPSRICTGEELVLNASGSKIAEGTKPSFSWDYGNGESASGEKVKYRYPKGGDYKLTLSIDDGLNSECSVSRKTLNIHVNEPPVPMLNKVEPVCISEKGKRLYFDASSSYDPEGSKLIYSWDFGDGVTRQAGSKDSHKYGKSGTYKVVVSVDDGSGLGCAVAKDKIHVKLNKPPQLNAYFPEKGYAGTAVIFDGSQSFDPDGDGLSYFWSFGDGKNKSEARASHTYKKKGKYKIVFTIDDNSGSPCSTEWKKYKLRIADPLPQETKPEKK